MVEIISVFELELIARIILSIILSAIIGFEREITHKPAGLRTYMFIGMGSCLFTISSLYLLPTTVVEFVDPTRIAAGIVTGTAFIGAGSIIARKGDIKGVTTAASMWVVASIGLTIGLGNYLIPIASTIITFIILRLGVIADRRSKKKVDMN